MGDSDCNHEESSLLSSSSNGKCMAVSDQLCLHSGHASAFVRFQDYKFASKRCELTGVSENISTLTPEALLVPGAGPATPVQSLMSQNDMNGIDSNNQNLGNVAFPTNKAEVSVGVADGYKWRKYGQKQVKGSKNFRSYYKCKHAGCLAKKKVQQSDLYTNIVSSVYIGQHNHDLPGEECSGTKGRVDSSVQKPDGFDMPACLANDRQSSTLESEQPSSSSSTCNIGTKIGESNGDEPSRRNGVSIRSANFETKYVIHATGDKGALIDDYRWRKYGQKVMKRNSLLRSYFRCSSAGCPARKRVERAADGLEATITTYGVHNHEMPVSERTHGLEVVSHLSCDTSNKAKSLTDQSSPTNWSVGVDQEHLGDEVLELGGEKALEFAQTLLSIGSC